MSAALGSAGVFESLIGSDGGRSRLVCLNRHGARQPIILVHGMFTDRRFWLSDRGVGLAAYLAEAGHPVVIIQRRGLADSPACTARCGLNEHLAHDLPVLAARLATRHGWAPVWVGHSFGGVAIARAAADHLPADNVGGLVLLASQFEIAKRLLDWPGNLVTRGITRMLGYLPARAAGLGPVNEPAAAALDACAWVSRGRRDSAWIRSPLGRITAPVLAISGAADAVDPTAGCHAFVRHMSSRDVIFIRAGRADGFEIDYDHPGIVVSKPAQREIWPCIADWLDAHSAQRPAI